MRWSDLFKMCRKSLRRRKGRTFLTVLGVFIGCVSIIVMVSIGAGMRESQEQMIANMGDVTVIQVYGGGGEAKLNDDAVEAFRAVDGVQAVMPKADFGSMLGNYSVALKAGTGDRYVCDWANVLGIDTSALEDMGYEILDGDFPSGDSVAVGQYLAYNFRDTYMPDGKNYVDRYQWDENGNLIEDDIPDPFFDPTMTKITMSLSPWDVENPVPYDIELKVSGIMKEDYGKGWETSEGIVMDIDTLRALKEKVTGEKNTSFEYSEVYIKTADISLVGTIEDEIKNQGYYTYSMESTREELEKQTRQIELMLGGLGAISLLVAAIGITNTMTMSVSERTKEIGIMKAIGCYVTDIRRLFLMESGVIGLIGGVLGLIFSFLISVGINLYTFMYAYGNAQPFTWELLSQAVFGGENIARTSVITLPLAIFALIFSLMIGLISGYSPANKAVKVSALEAIRSE